MEIKLTKIVFGNRKRYLMLIMKTFIFLLCTTVFSLTTSEVNSQTKIVIDSDRMVTVDEVFKIIKQQTDYTFIYQKDIFKNLPPVQLKKGVIRVDKLLNQSLAGGNLNIALTQNNTIIIKEANTKQQQQVTGKVTDATGLPIPGVTVLIKGTGKGTATDFDGNYSITVPNPENVLVFTSLGFEKQEITVGNQAVINVTLKEAVATLEEVTINAGYYKTSRRLATGSIGSVKATEINRQPVVDPIEGLIGQVAGLQITPFNGTPGMSPTVRIRGINSLNNPIYSGNSNIPLFVIDGVPVFSEGINASGFIGSQGPQSPLAFLNTADIESIDVLKDADATAIYGSRGANGVILITTKQAKTGSNQIKVEYSHGQLTFPDLNDYKMLNTEEYLSMRKASLVNAGKWPVATSQQGSHPDLFLWDQTKNTNWREVLLSGIGKQSRASLSTSGGSEYTNYIFSTNMSKETSIYNFDDSSHKAVSGLLSVNHKAKDNGFHANFSVRYSNTINNQNALNFILKALKLAPNAPDLINSEGGINYENFNDNPLKVLEETRENQINHFLSSLTLGYKDILTGLNAKIDLGYTDQRVYEFNLVPLSSFTPAEITAYPGRGSHRLNSVKANTWFVEPQLNFTKKISEHTINALVGATLQSSTTEGIGVSGYGYDSDLLLTNIQAAQDKYVSSEFSEYKYMAIYTRLNYNYKNKYILNLTGRRDGSSRFGPNNKFGNFGAIGTAWVFSDEEFIKDKFSFLSFGKLKGSYGITGSDNIPNYGYLATYQSGYNYNNEASYTPVRAANPDYSWETNKKLEFALDLGLFKTRIRAEIAWYQNQSSNQLIGFPLSSVTGFSSLQSNFPAVVENKGLELTLNTINVSSKNFSWTSGFNISKERNQLKEFKDIESYAAYNNKYVIGQSLYGSKYYQSLGVNPDTGLYDIVDMNGDGKINSLDRQNFVDLRPDFYGGLHNTFSYKNWNLNIGLNFKKVKGKSFAAATFYGAGYYSSSGSNISTEFLDNNWQNPGDHTRFQQFNVSSKYYSHLGYNENSNNSIVDKSYIKLQNVSLTYNLPKNFIKNVGLSAANFYIRGQNLATFTSYKGIDPETGASLPLLRTFITGVQLTF